MRFAKLAGTAFVAASVMWGCDENSNGERPQPQKSVQENRGQTPGQQESPSSEVGTAGEADQYGRMPGDEHYGHDHPLQDARQNNQMQQGSPVQSQQATQPGEPDQYGRMPGDEHYGHDHPIQAGEQSNQNQQGSPVRQGSPVQTQQTAPTDGEPDKYGRMPGDEHYGHDHE